MAERVHLDGSENPPCMSRIQSAPIGANFVVDLSQMLRHYKSATKSVPIGADFCVRILFCESAVENPQRI